MTISGASLEVKQQTLDKRVNGIYYTPSEVTDVLCEWAIRTPDDCILEPSFGGCGFLVSSKQRLAELDCQLPAYNLFGCDIDPSAFDYLKSVTGNFSYEKRFLQEDFLKVRPEHFLVTEFDAVIGNPPYISRHNMAEAQKQSAPFPRPNTEEWRSAVRLVVEQMGGPEVLIEEINRLRKN